VTQKKQPRLAPDGTSLLEWLSKPVEGAIQKITHPDIANEQRAILTRMTSDHRLDEVCTTLLSKDRAAGGYKFPTIPRPGAQPRSPKDSQHAALQEAFRLAFCFTRDQKAVSKPDEIAEHKASLEENSSRLRNIASDLYRARETDQLGLVDSTSKEIATEHILALGEVADWLDQLAVSLRKAGDPLMIARDTGNPLLRGVTILIADEFLRLFGNRMERTAKTLASIATGIEETTGPHGAD
jgi:hypothetical protein